MSFRTLSAQSIAAQITATDHKLLKAVDLDEFNDVGWAKTDKNARSPNLVRFIDFANQVTYWLISEVLNVKDTNDRAKLIVHFLNVGDELLKINNYNGASLIILGLWHPAVTRLKATWILVDDKHMAIQQRLFDMFLRGLDQTKDDYELYRKAVKGIKPPYIPFMRLLLEELADACTNPADHTLSTRHYKYTIQNSRIIPLDQNQPAPHEITKEIKACVEAAVSVNYDFNEKGISFDLEKYIRNYKVMDNEKTYKTSHEIEPRTKQRNDSSSNWLLAGLGVAAVVAVGVAVFFYTNKQSGKVV